MRRNNGYMALLWLLMLGCILGSAAVLAGGRLHLVDAEAYAMLERYAKLESVRECISREYVDPVEDAVLMEGALRGMLGSLGDPYTFYYTPEELARRDEALSGSYHGIGILLHANDAGEPEIIRVYRDSPAQRAGLLAGDVLLEADGAAISAADAEAFNDAVERISGEDGTELALTIRRNGERLNLTVIRGSAVSAGAAWSMLEGKIGYISIFHFSGDAVECFREAMDALQAEGMKGLVIDLRGNPGGVMGDVTAIADDLLPEGLIAYTQTRDGSREEYYAEGAYCEVPLAVLVNGSSASASELLAAAVQDSGRGVVVGTQTYGKGVVQALVEFTEDGSGMQYTFARYYSPSGRSIHGSGVTPDLVADGDTVPALSGIPDPEGDAQLRAALEYLLEE